MPWPEVQDCIDKKKHEVRITGATLAKRLEESDSGSSSVPEEFCTDLGPLLTFLELSGTSSLTSLPSSINVMHQLHELLVTNCGLTELPDGIGSLPLLRTLIGKVDNPAFCKPEATQYFQHQCRSPWHIQFDLHRTPLCCWWGRQRPSLD